LKLASRNLTDVQVEQADSVNVYELLRYEKIVATKPALEKLQSRAARP
jgi:ribosomal protein L4